MENNVCKRRSSRFVFVIAAAFALVLLGSLAGCGSGGSTDSSSPKTSSGDKKACEIWGPLVVVGNPNAYSKLEEISSTATDPQIRELADHMMKYIDQRAYWADQDPTLGLWNTLISNKVRQLNAICNGIGNSQSRQG